MKFNANLKVLGRIDNKDGSQHGRAHFVDMTATPAISPSAGDLIISTATGTFDAGWTGLSGSVTASSETYLYNGSSYEAWHAPVDGSKVIDITIAANPKLKLYNGTSWNEAAGYDDEQAQDAIGTILTDSSNIDFTYNDGTPSITADLTDTTATPGSYGDAQTTPTFTVDAKGRLTASGSVTIDDNTKIPLTQKGAANGVATLDGNSKIPSSQLPAIAITDVQTVADIAARDALTIGTGDGEIQEGDVVIVTDASADPAITSGAASYIYNGSSYSLLKSGDEVLSVNGATGTVTVNAINQLTGHVTTAAASGSESEAATIAYDAAKLQSQSFTLTGTGAKSSFTCTHSFGTQAVSVEIVDENYNTVIPDSISRTDANTVVVTFHEPLANTLVYRAFCKEIGTATEAAAT